MHILMLHPHDIYSSSEPWTIRIKSIAKEFQKQGYRVKLVYFPLKFSFNQVYFWEDIETIPLLRRPGPRTSLINIRRLIQLTKWADVIHFQKCHHYCAIPALIAAYVNMKPIHYDWDDWEEKIYIDSSKKPFWPMVIFLRILERLLPRLVNTISVSSDKLKEMCLDFGIEKGKVFKVPVGVDLKLFNSHHSGEQIKRKYGLKGPIVLYLGQLHGGQYGDLFLKAAQIISRQYPEINFLIVGGGYKLGELKSFAKRLRLRNVIFTGAIPHSKVPNYVACADVCVACFVENDITRCKSPLKIMEYLASGKAIVASDVGEIRNMVGESAFLVPPDSAQSIARGILELLADKESREKLGKKARLQAEKSCGWSLRAESLIRAYKLALNRAR